MKLDRETIKKIRGLIVFTVLVLVAAWNYKIVLNGVEAVWKVIFPFVLGGAFAFLINIPMNFFERRLFRKSIRNEKKWAVKIARPVSLLVTLLVVFGIVALVMLVVIPELGRTLLNLGKTIQVFVPQVQAWAVEVFHEYESITEKIMEINFKWDVVLEKSIQFLKNGAGNVIGSTYEAAKSIISGIATFFIALVFSCYILLQKEKLGEQVKKFMSAFFPEDWKNIFLALGSVIHKNFTHFFTGQCLEAVILGLMFLVTMLIFRLPYALLISVLIAFTALIPVFGAFVGCAVGTLLIFMIDPLKAVVFLVIFIVIQQIEGNFIYPHVVGNSVGLPPIWVLVAVTVGANLMGVAGMLIFIPLTSVVYTILRGIVNRRLGLKE